VEECVKIIQPLMEEAIKLSVPIKVDCKVGDNWGEMDKLKF
jgi:DNA polymerase I-like protein with 3'-5' exonuclease and polymerase domains